MNLLEPLLGDKEAYVRQGVLLAMSFILVQVGGRGFHDVLQHNNTMNARVTAFRERQAKKIGEKAEDSIVKFGAIIGQVRRCNVRIQWTCLISRSNGRFGEMAS